ncbi:hypothetical protein [Oryzobacter telluris]|uniref:hypothetical protein n=1 Tax=Oryzobacter telluris TaxID=3149179 RepID=UPI00370D4CB4
MSVVRGIEAAAWVVFWLGVGTMLVRAALRLRTPRQKYRTGWVMAMTMLVSGPVFAVVYALEGLGVADTFWGGGGRRGPWFMVVAGVIMTAVAPAALRRTRSGLAGRRHD